MLELRKEIKEEEETEQTHTHTQGALQLTLSLSSVHCSLLPQHGISVILDFTDSNRSFGTPKNIIRKGNGRVTQIIIQHTLHIFAKHTLFQEYNLDAAGHSSCAARVG